MRIWMDRTVEPDLMARMEEVAEVCIDLSGGLQGLEGADAAIIGSRVAANGAFMDLAGPNFKAVARAGIGVDNVNIADATERGVLVINTPDAPTESTAQHAIALLLAVTKHVPQAHAMMRENCIDRPPLLGLELRGRVAGVIGFGRIGKRVSDILLKAFYMKVLTYDPYVDSSIAAERGVEMVDELDTMLRAADVLMVHPELTEETRHMVGERELLLMKPGAYIVNASRGPVVDERALARVMKQGHLAGAGLDVFDPEPPTPDSPLYELDNIIVTPHIASYTTTGVRAMNVGAVEQILGVLRGERPVSLKNPEAWPGRVAGANL